LFLDDGSSHLFVFESRDERDGLYHLLSTQTAFASRHRSTLNLDEVTRRWQRRELSNFQYLMHLNNEAGRTFNDLTQYPVFPQIIADYVSSTLRLDSAATYRDLSKPIGALNNERLSFFLERFESMPPADPTLGLPPPFLYGTHYSTPGYVLFYLVRVAPEYMLCLQNGKFDAADRMFHSIQDMWESVLHNPADLKELIPEFFCGAGEFLSNSDDLDLGHRSTGERLHDVVLPPWAESPRDFIRKMAKALESDYVSEHLHAWIDLIFGYKQRGEAAIASNNLFYHLTYEGAVDLEAIKDPRERAAIENQIQEFGQTPSQLFLGAHPRRSDLAAPIIIRTEADTMSSNNNNNNNNNNNSSSNMNTNNSNSSNNNNVPHSRLINQTNNNNSSMTSTNNNNHNNNSNAIAVARPGTPQLMSPVTSDRSLDLIHSNNSNNNAAENIAIVHLGDDFRRALESELLLQNDADSDEENREHLGTRDREYNADQERAQEDAELAGMMMANSHQSTANLSGNSSVSSSSMQYYYYPIDSQRVRFFPSEHFYWHTKSITDIAVSLQKAESADNASSSSALPNSGLGIGDEGVFLPQSGRRKFSAIVSTVSKDALLKVIKVDQDLDLSLVFHRNYNNHNNHSQNLSQNPLIIDRPEMNVSRTQCTISRSYSASGSSLSCCALTGDASKVLLGSWDNHVYAYNIATASAAGKKFVHYDSVTALALDDDICLTGSLDGTVKLWQFRSQGMQATSGPASQPGFLVGPICEFEDHELPVVKVALSQPSIASASGSARQQQHHQPLVESRLASAGAEDGSVIVWDIAQQLGLFCFAASPAKRPITALRFLSLAHSHSVETGTVSSGSNSSSSMNASGNSSGINSTPNHLSQRLLVATQDGKLLCLDCFGTLLAALQVDTTVLCLDVLYRGAIEAIVAGGCVDGSVRVWALQTVGVGGAGKLRETVRYPKAHNGAVTAIAAASVSSVTSSSPQQQVQHQQTMYHSYSDMPAEILVTGSEDCSIRIWRLGYDR
jgi:hypothetical protein